MAVQTPPFVSQNSSHGSELVRREALSSLVYGSAGGVVPATPTASANPTAGVAGCSDLKVNAPASGMSCLVNAGQVYVPGSLGSGAGYGIGTGYGMPVVTLNGAAAPTVSATAAATVVQLTTQGIYYCYNDNSAGQVSLTIAASNATNPRIDVVVAQVEDAVYSGAANDWKLAVVTGTAAASPTVPALPANVVVLAYIWVPAASVNVTAGNILDLRVAANRNPFRAKAYRNGAWSAVNAVIVFDTIVSNLDAGFATGTGLYTVPVSGLYLVTSQFGYTPTATTDWAQAQINRNGVAYALGPTTLAAINTNVNGGGAAATAVVPCSAGDTLGALAGATASRTGETGQTHTYIDIALLSAL